MPGHNLVTWIFWPGSSKSHPGSDYPTRNAGGNRHDLRLLLRRLALAARHAARSGAVPPILWRLKREKRQADRVSRLPLERSRVLFCTVGMNPDKWRIGSPSPEDLLYHYNPASSSHASWETNLRLCAERGRDMALVLLLSRPGSRNNPHRSSPVQPNSRCNDYASAAGCHGFETG